jgi:hypothetical protein
MELGFDLARHGGPVFDTLRAGAWEKPCEFLGFRRDRDTAQATVRQVHSQFLRVAAIRFDLIVCCHRDGRRIHDDVRDPRLGEGTVQHEA